MRTLQIAVTVVLIIAMALAIAVGAGGCWYVRNSALHPSTSDA